MLRKKTDINALCYSADYTAVYTISYHIGGDYNINIYRTADCGAF